jgi:hypothetical protein
MGPWGRSRVLRIDHTGPVGVPRQSIAFLDLHQQQPAIETCNEGMYLSRINLRSSPLFQFQLSEPTRLHTIARYQQSCCTKALPVMESLSTIVKKLTNTAMKTKKRRT